MIVRIMGEGQLDLPEDSIDGLNELDAKVTQAVESGDEAAFRQALDALLADVRKVGKPVADDELVSSDFILPPADSDLAEVRDLLSGDGLVPG